jgi:hypothetical protein
VYVGRVCPVAGYKTNLKICFEVTVATAHPTRNLVEFQQTPAGHTRPTYTVCGLLKGHILYISPRFLITFNFLLQFERDLYAYLLKKYYSVRLATGQQPKNLLPVSVMHESPIHSIFSM